MNLSPTQRNSPKEKRSFTFFRSRTLSSSSTDSNTGVPSTSPRLSPRSLFDKVRKRSQSDAKSQPSVDQISASAGSNSNNYNLNIHQQNLQYNLQQQLLLQQQQQLLLSQQVRAESGPRSVSSGTSVRKHLSHSISEENDEAVRGDCYSNEGNIVESNQIFQGEFNDAMSSLSPNRLIVRV